MADPGIDCFSKGSVRCWPRCCSPRSVTSPGSPARTSWAGLTPRHYASDRTTRRGHISKEGSALVRWAVVEAVQRPCEPSVRALRERILARRGPGGRNIAKFAAAHRMLDIVFYTLRDGTCRAFADTQDAA
jgi:Transposase IS116/IS110/IS902 family